LIVERSVFIKINEISNADVTLHVL